MLSVSYCGSALCVRCDLLPVVNDGASHGTVPLGWDMCWLTTRRYDGPMAFTRTEFSCSPSEPEVLRTGPHRRYSYPRQGTRSYLADRDTTAVREGVSNVLGLGVPILCIYHGDESPRCMSYDSTMLFKYPYQQSVVRVGVVGFTPAVNGGILYLKKDRTVSAATLWS